MSRFVVGLDAGASKTLLRGQCPGRAAPIERRGPGANPNRTGLDEAAAILVTLIESALQECAAVDRLSVCAGVAGAGRPQEQTRLTDALRTALSKAGRPVDVEVVHDALIALDAAYDAGSGLVVIAGTGSVVLARTTDGALARAGGWGHVLGDDGSGYAIGRAGLRAVAAAFDGGADTALSPRVREHCGIDDREQLLETIYQTDFSVQAVAPLVIDAAAGDDAVADEILSSQVTKLTEQVGWLVDREAPIAPRITLVGGMLQNDHYARRLRRCLQARFPDRSVAILQEAPVVGALRRAHRLRPATS
jgi:N-acetylglucosamine kinase-like BadF-type ATPase